MTYSEELPGTLTADKTLVVTNTIQESVGDLTITKTGISEKDHYDNTDNPEQSEKQSTIFTITGPDNFSIQIIICGNDSVTIKDLAPGDYSVAETDWSWRYSPSNNQTVQTTTVSGGTEVTVTFENEREMTQWLSGDSYCKNCWSGTDGSIIIDRKEDDD